MISKRRWALATVQFSLAFLLMTIGLARLFAQQYDLREERAAERRLTSLEGSVASLVENMKTIKERGNWDWIQQICLALLVGERGNDVLRRKRRREFEEE